MHMDVRYPEMLGAIFQEIPPELELSDKYSICFNRCTEIATHYPAQL